MGEAIEEVHGRLFPNGRFDEQLLALLAGLLSRTEVVDIPEAWKAVGIIDYDLRDIPPDQADELVTYAERVFATTTDSSMAFETSCWLGEDSHTRPALDALVRLKASAGPNALWSVPHGFEHLVRDAVDPMVRAEAFRHLLSMRTRPILMHAAKLA